MFAIEKKLRTNFLIAERVSTLRHCENNTTYNEVNLGFKYIIYIYFVI